MNKQLDIFIKEVRRQNKERQECEAVREMEFQESKRARDEIIAYSLKPASPKKYASWLKGFMQNGGEPAHYYDYQMPNKFFVAKRNAEINPLYGSLAIHIIVPKGLDVVGELGHCNLYFMDGFIKKGMRGVSVYENTTF